MHAFGDGVRIGLYSCGQTDVLPARPLELGLERVSPQRQPHFLRRESNLTHSHAYLVVACQFFPAER